MSRAAVRRWAAIPLLLVACSDPASLPPTNTKVYTFDGPSRAIEGCGFVISQPGNYHVAKDLLDCPAQGIAINASGVTLRLNGHTLSGQAAALLMDVGSGISVGHGVTDGVSQIHIIGPGKVTGFWAGVLFEQVVRSVVVNVTLKQNEYGFALNAGFGAMQATRRSRLNAITGNTLEANIGHAFTINGADDNLLSGNTIVANKGFAVLLYSATRNVVISNRADSNGAGIVVDISDSLARENTIVGNAASGNRLGDLIDRWNDCTHNTWRANQFGKKSAQCIK